MKTRDTAITTGNVYTVSRLTENIKHLLEKTFPIIWVEGEISNFKVPASGHFYFTLKDSTAQISGVMFANQNRLLKFKPEDGMRITGLGRIGVYAPRGTYQIIFEHMMPKGAGELLVAFEELKKKLAAEGLFDEDRKKPIPFLPSKINIISSATGAVVHDIIQIITRRYPGVHIEIIPASVQGDAAPGEIAAALELANRQDDADVIVVARGGGSLEDLFAFNTETVARAVAASKIPVVSAVGHETDFTICDFVADLRAPTPSAAAELIVPVKNDLLMAVARLRTRLAGGVRKNIQSHRSRLKEIRKRLIDPRRKIGDARLRLDDLSLRLARAFTRDLKTRKERLAWQAGKLMENKPARITENYRSILQLRTQRLTEQFQQKYINDKARQLDTLTQRLAAINPGAVLKRGYSITRIMPEKQIVRCPADVRPDDSLEIILAEGTITGQVTTGKPNNRES
ncbi:MAG: exodeoxyribonuclease VII large subunit [Thermodesulfobacteriota bacterium]|nr:exodeoxyribonuclease VII large subunit [Thermodesulfobacteriota bacterium]